MRIRWTIRGAAVLLAVAVAAMTPQSFAPLPVAAADPETNAPGDSHVVSIHVDDVRHWVITVFSAAMDSEFTVEVQRPSDTSVPRPVLYLLSGGSGGVGPGSWDRQTHATDFLADKQVNVVQPIGGAASYYADWRNPDPRLGIVKWKTFLTDELPPLLDTALGANGRNAIAGVSMSGTSVLQLPIARPGLYRAVAAYSGCAQISDPLGQAYVRLTVAYSAGDAANMYGPPGDPMWAANDPYLNAESLRGLDLYLSSGNGLPGPYDKSGGRGLVGAGPGALVNQVLVGGIIEAATDQCTRILADRLTSLNIPATVNLRPYGTHSWGYWDDELKASWPVLAHGLGL
ncbi:alpha/beta hydrolase family protein [Nocardia sp. NPDC052001]|uniref:alpha/beta hydrolase n=1 Tax=Nocardia sp. NPDC052001 TaxID=3154853 RepID=UPI0034255176